MQLKWYGMECKRKYDKGIPKTSASPGDLLKTWENVINQVPNIYWKNYIRHGKDSGQL